MATAKLTSKGQITVPKAVRDRLRIRAGDQIDFIEEDGVYRIRKILQPNRLDKWRGYLKNLEGQDPDEMVREMRGE